MWAAADMAFGLMAVINIVAIVLLTPTVVAVTKDYQRKREQGDSIDFSSRDCKVQGSTEAGIWDK